MNVSPVQLRFYVFSRVIVDPGEPQPLSVAKMGGEELLDWQGVNLVSNIEFGWGDGHEDDPRAFGMRLGLKIDNESGKPAPYKVDIEALGYFDLIGNIPKQDREDIAKVN